MRSTPGLLSRRPSGLTPPQLGEHYARVFVGERCTLGPTLVMPLRLLWREYRPWAVHRGWTPTAQELRSLLESVPWAEVQERGGRGRFRTVVLGVGLRPDGQ